MLTAEQIVFRQRGIGGSDANTLSSGDDDRIMRLWREKRGETQPDDLSDVLAVQMGSFTEPLNRSWFTKQTGRAVTHDGDHRMSLDEPFMLCNLDGLTDNGATVWEGKHLSAFTKEDDALARYLPQLTHNMIVCGLKRAVLSCFFGNAKFACFDVALDPIYAAQLIAAERDFWECVETGRAPVAVYVAAPVEPIRTADMTGRNDWAAAAADWIRTRQTAQDHTAAAKALKGMVEADVIRAFGHGLEIKRDKRGALSISIIKE